MMIVAAAGSAVAGSNPIVERIRQVDARVADANVALKEGYTPITCASGPNGGAMDVHCASGALLKTGKIDIARPQAVKYEPEANGKKTLGGSVGSAIDGRRSWVMPGARS